MRFFSTALSALAIALLASPAARAGECKFINTTIVTTFSFTSCESPFGICTEGTIDTGELTGTTWFTAQTIAPGDDPDVLLYTGQLVITTESGTLTLNDNGLLNGATGQYLETQDVLGGTDLYSDATGTLRSQGMATGTGFAGSLRGAVCAGGDPTIFNGVVASEAFARLMELRQ